MRAETWATKPHEVRTTLKTTPPIMPAAPCVTEMSMPHRAEQAERPKQMPAQMEDETSGASSRLRYSTSLSTPAPPPRKQRVKTAQLMHATCPSDVWPVSS